MDKQKFLNLATQSKHEILQTVYLVCLVHSLTILVPVHTGMGVFTVLSTVNMHLFDRICLCHLIGNFFCPLSAFLLVVVSVFKLNNTS